VRVVALHHVTSSTPAQRQSQQHRGQFFGIVGRKTRPPLLYTDVQVQKLRSPFLTLVWHYLHHFITSMKPAGGDGFQLTQGRGFNDPTAASVRASCCYGYRYAVQWRRALASAHDLPGGARPHCCIL